MKTYDQPDELAFAERFLTLKGIGFAGRIVKFTADVDPWLITFYFTEGKNLKFTNGNAEAFHERLHGGHVWWERRGLFR